MAASGQGQIELDALDPSAHSVEETIFSRAFAQLDSLALGIGVGVVSGGGLWLATALLLLRGGENVGWHLWRLSFYLPGYDISWAGAFFGLLDAGLLGFGVGASSALLWNAYHRFFMRMAAARETRRELGEL